MPAVKTVEPPDLFFEDFAEGQQFSPVTKGPMMVGHQVRWAGACDNYDSEFHHDEHVAKAQGLPGIILSGPLMASYLMTEVAHWVGRNARLITFADRNVGSTMPRDMAYLRGHVKKTYEQGGQGRLEIECWIENQRGENTTPGRAVAAVPHRTWPPRTGEREAETGGPSDRGAGGRPVDAAASEIEKFLAGLIGPVGAPDTMAVELGAVRKMARAVEDCDPIHYDAAAAIERGYRGVVAPWPLLWLFYFNAADHRIDFPFGKATVHGEDEYEFHEPMVVGDEITLQTAVTDARLKQGRSGQLGLVVEERRFTNQGGALCAVLRTVLIRR